MPLYVLHYATIDAEGRLSIDCQGPFPTTESAQKQQTSLLTAFKVLHHSRAPLEAEEQYGSFHRIAYAGLLTEIQSHMKYIYYM